MKKIVAMLIVSILIFSGCTSNKISYEISNEKINIITTIFPYYDFVRQIAKDKVNIHMLIPPGSESHTFDPTPKDIINIRECDVFIYTGGESDHWVKELISQADTDTVFISLMDIVPPLEQQHKEGMQETHLNHEEHHKEYDEHIWTSPVNAITICNGICNILCEKDNKNADFYKNNCNQYINRLTQLDTNVKNIISSSSTSSFSISSAR